MLKSAETHRCRRAVTAASLLAVLLAAGGCAGHPGSRDVGRSDPDSLPEAYRPSTAALYWPGATRAFQITPEGGLYNGEWRVLIDGFGDGQRLDAPRTIAYEERWRPVAHWRRRSGRVRFDFEAVALPFPGASDTGLVVSLRVTATNSADSPLSADLALTLAPQDSAPPFVAFDAPDTAAELRWGPDRSLRAIHAYHDRSGEPTAGGDRVTRREHWELAARASRSARFLVPAYPARSTDLELWARVPHDRRAGEVRRFWAGQLARGTRFALGDPEVERALDAARVLLLGCRERRGAAWLPIGAPLHYRDVWLRDGARLVAALAVSGHTREARELAGGLTLFQWPQGAFVSQRGQPDGTGQALWAFEQAWLRPAPGDSALRLVEAAVSAVRWCERQREFGRQTGWPFGTMMPFADPGDNELVRAQLVGTDAWTIAGYRATARLLRGAGRTAEADSVAEAGARYLADFRLALERSGSPDVPPSWQGAGNDWGNLSVVWPCGVLAADDPRVAALARRVWATAGGAGLCTYGMTDSLHYYLGADLGTWALLAGRRAQADSVLDAMLRWRSASGGSGELFSRAGGYGRSLPSHATSAAALVSLVRNALVFDDGDTLNLTLGARDSWWRRGRLRGAPTRWGLLDLDFRRDEHSAEWRWSAVPVWTALTLPPGTRLDGPPGPPLIAASSGTALLAPPGTRRARARIRSAGGSL